MKNLQVITGVDNAETPVSAIKTVSCIASASDKHFSRPPTPCLDIGTKYRSAASWRDAVIGFGAISAAIALDSSGPILFRQQRTGLNGRIFVIYKFRTMTVTTPGASVSHATREDKRVTRVGRFLRETSLDEIPQLLNILKGEMALVGPRPHAVEHDRHYAGILPNYDGRFAVRPGLTGLAQIQGLRGEVHDISCMARRVDADVLYATHWSFLGDMAIVVRTLPLLLARVNAY